MASHPPPVMSASQKLSAQNESTWLQVGTLAESMNEPERAMNAYEAALRHNPHSIQALTQAAALCRAREQYSKAVDYFQRILNIDQTNGEIWGALGHCFLMMDDLQRAYTAYQQALYHLPNPKEPKLWYGIGILYDRYGSYEHAEEAFSAVIRMEPKFEKANEIYFRLGIIYKQQGKYDTSLSCFRYILSCPPKPLTEIDIWFQIGHVYEQQKEYQLARDAYERVLQENPSHAKVLQQLGWLYHQQNSSFSNQELAIQYLTRSLEADMNDAQTWYLLGRCYMAQQKYNKAYEAYQQAVYRDGRNPTFWCSIGVLYYQINQYRDALDAYSRAIRLNPYISEVWYDLGTLYESCNNQINDALDAYTRALELDPTNPHIKQRLQMLRNAQAGGGQVQTAAAQPQQPVPQDINPQGYPNGAGMHHNAPNHFYQGPQPPSQVGYARGPQQEQRSAHPGSGPQMDHERRELPAIQGTQSGPYPPQHLAQREDRSYSANDRQVPQQVSDSRSGRSKQARPTSPKLQADRRGASTARPSMRHDSTAPSQLASNAYHPHDEISARHGHDARSSPQVYASRSANVPARSSEMLPIPQENAPRNADLVLRPVDQMSRRLEHPKHIGDMPRLPEMAARDSQHPNRLPEIQPRSTDQAQRHMEHLRPLDIPSRGGVDSMSRQNDHTNRLPFPLERTDDRGLRRPDTSTEAGNRLPEVSDRAADLASSARQEIWDDRKRRSSAEELPEMPSRDQHNYHPYEDAKRAHKEEPEGNRAKSPPHGFDRPDDSGNDGLRSAAEALNEGCSGDHPGPNDMEVVPAMSSEERDDQGERRDVSNNEVEGRCEEQDDMESIRRHSIPSADSDRAENVDEAAEGRPQYPPKEGNQVPDSQNRRITTPEKTETPRMPTERSGEGTREQEDLKPFPPSEKRSETSPSSHTADSTPAPHFTGVATNLEESPGRADPLRQDVDTSLGKRRYEKDDTEPRYSPDSKRSKPAADENGSARPSSA